MKSIPSVLNKPRLEALTSRFRSVRAAVIGDIALDAYWTVDMTRSHLSRETPHFPRPVISERYSPGAGGNVAQDLAALGCAQVTVFSVLGRDTWAGLLKNELEIRGISTTGIIESQQRRTNAYIKPLLTGYNSQQEDARLDFENLVPLSADMELRLVDILANHLSQVDAVLVADQFEELGIITPTIRQYLIELARKHPSIWFLVDSRQRIGEYQHMVLKPNWLEAFRAVYPEDDVAGMQLFGENGSASEALNKMGHVLVQNSKRPVFITLSEHGVLVCAQDGCTHVAAAPVKPPLDVVGAGDAFIAALAASLCAGATAEEAGAIANLAAGVTTEKLNQTGTATPNEILARYDLTVAQEGK